MPHRLSARLGVAGLALLAPALASAESGSAEREPRQELAGFVGVTNVDNRQRPTLGIGYEWRLTPRFGAGLVADWVLGGDGYERRFRGRRDDHGRRGRNRVRLLNGRGGTL